MNMQKKLMWLPLLCGCMLLSLLGCRQNQESEGGPATGGGLVVPTSLPEAAREPTESAERAEPLLIQDDGVAEAEDSTDKEEKSTPTAVPPCTPRTDWERYTVVQGDTLSELAASVGSSVKTLAEANCLIDPGQLVIGSQLRLPRQPEPAEVAWPEPVYIYPNGMRQYGSEACFQPPFPPNSGLTAGYPVTINSRTAQGEVNAYTEAEALFPQLKIADGDYGFLAGSPLCYSLEVDGVERPLRRWPLEADDTYLYVDEYLYGDTGTRFVQLESVGTPPRVDTFRVSPTEIEIDQTLEVTWRVTHVDAVILYVNAERFVLPAAGTRTFQLPAVEALDLTFLVSLYTETLDEREIYLDSTLVSVITPPTITIRDFSVTPNPSLSNGRVTLRWDVVGEGNGRLLWYPMIEQEVLVAEIQPGEDSLTITLPDRFIDYFFVLELEDRHGLPVQDTLLLTTTCPYAFFVVELDTQNGSCPTGIPTVIQAAYQPFERGFMVWQPVPGEEYAAILVFTPDGSVRVYDDRLLDETAPDPAEEPPAGLFKPESGFGQVWAQYPEVRSMLGWGTAAESGYVMTWQQVDRLNPQSLQQIGDIYLTLPDGRAIRYTHPYANLLQSWFFVD